jgi:steroid 5-alpha reductase family enzyme
VLIWLLGIAIGVLSVSAVALWGLSLRLGDASIADVAWGPGFGLVAWLGVAIGDGDRGRSLLAATLVTVWATRLVAHLVARRRASGREDPRYTDLRRRHGRRFGRRSLVTIFVFQAALLWVIALPLMSMAAHGRPLQLLDLVPVAIWAFGFGYEVVADEQLRRFRRRRSSDGQILDAGLWRLSRHPNYFGEIVLWWGLGLLAVTGGAAPWTLLGPAVLTFTIVRVSGPPLLERRMAGRPGFARYVATTRPLVPGRPRPARTT